MEFLLLTEVHINFMNKLPVFLFNMEMSYTRSYLIFLGTMDTTTTKLLSVHIEALLPATALELDIPQNIQVASLMGIGLLYQGTAKRHIAEVLLQEIGKICNNA